MLKPLLASAAAAALLAQPAMSQPVAAQSAAEARAAATVARMTDAELFVLTAGDLGVSYFPGMDVPKAAIPAAGYVPGIPRLKIPALYETDASLGVAWLDGRRGKEGATALPSALSMASGWNPDVVRKGAALIGGEARAKGFNVLLAGGVNLMREPRNGRTFEYFSEDPWLTGVLGGAAVRGVQSNDIISTVKHYALNGQETGRSIADHRIADAAARESDLLAFQIAIEQGDPGSVMCGYNKVNGAHTCESDYLLNQVLKRDWRYKGFVMSDWGAVHSLSASLNGLDQQSGKQLDQKPFLGAEMQKAAATDPAYIARARDMNRRILTAIYANRLDVRPPVKTPIDEKAGYPIAEQIAAEGIVLLRNERNALPLAAEAKTIAVIGGYAAAGVLSGGGSSQVQATGGPAASVPNSGEGIAAFFKQDYQRSVPLAAIRAANGKAKVTYSNGDYLSEAVAAAKAADVAIVFANEWRAEAVDVPDLTLPHGQDALIAAVAAANPNTIVVLQTGGPVLMPWLDKTAAVIEAWYPGIRGAEAIAAVLFGKVNPGGHLPITFPASLAQLPRPVVDGTGMDIPMFGAGAEKLKLTVNYDIEGSDVGYRWNARRGHKALFPFGYGLSYTTFRQDGLTMNGLDARLSVTNTGKRPGAEVAQLYLVSRGGEAKQRLVGFSRVALQPGETRTVSLAIDPRLLADWNGGGWTIRGGTYRFALGTDAEHLGQPVDVRLADRSWKD